jgi:hypothetical protein
MMAKFVSTITFAIPLCTYFQMETFVVTNIAARAHGLRHWDEAGNGFEPLNTSGVFARGT